MKTAWVSKEDMVEALVAIRLWYWRRRLEKGLAKTGGRLFSFDKELAEMYISAVEPIINDRTLDVKIMDTELVLVSKYPHLAYAKAEPFISGAVLAFAAHPPQMTTLRYPVLKTSAYINVNFIPTRLKTGKMHRNIMTKYFYHFFWNTFRYKKKKELPKFPLLETLYKNKIIQYRNQGKTEAHAARLAMRDVARVLIGNVWLVQMYYLVKTGDIQPSDIVLPYELAQNPQLHKTYIDPVHTCYKNKLPAKLLDEIKDITWRWLLETTKTI